ncbi:hypothetical protein OK883_01915, partial [Streptococcus pneumoniae]|nr:hypothetical protein [Streptococcus pneumoniae]
TLKNAWTTSRQVNFFWVANFNLKFGNQVNLGIYLLTSVDFWEFFSFFFPVVKILFKKSPFLDF